MFFFSIFIEGGEKNNIGVIKKIISTDTTLTRQIPTYVTQAQTPLSRITSYLDSLGYLSYTINSTVDTIELYVAPQFDIDTVIYRFRTRSTVSLENYRLSLKKYSKGNSDAIARALLQLYSDNGYPFVQIEQFHSISMEKQTVSLLYEINPQEKVLIGKTLFKGNKRIITSLLSKDLMYKKGDLYSRIDLNETERRLRERPYIDTVKIYPPEIYDDTLINTIGNDSTIESEFHHKVLIPIKIVEKRGLTLDGIITYASTEEDRNQWTGKGTIHLLNMFHRGENIELTYEGTEVLQKVALALEFPYMFSLPFFTEFLFDFELHEKEYGFIRAKVNALASLKNRWYMGGGVQFHETTVKDTLSNSWSVYGMQFIARRAYNIFRAGEFHTSLNIETGTSFAYKNDKNYTRFSVNIRNVLHIPLNHRQSFLVTYQFGSINSHSEDTLHTTELIPIGGVNSIRGYEDNQFTFKTAGFLSLEYLFYLNKRSTISLFVDGGAGIKLEESYTLHNMTKMGGYGIALMLPIRVGSLKLSWARRYNEKRGLGRVHIGFDNGFRK